MKRKLILILAFFISLSACGYTQPVPSQPSATPTPRETTDAIVSGIPTVEPTLATLQLAVYPPGARTGLAEIDRVIDALLTHDSSAIKGLTEYLEVGCANLDGLGGPPPCNEGESPGTLVEVVPVLGSEGYHMRAAEYESWSGPDVIGLLAVYSNLTETYSDPNYPSGDYSLVFLLPGGIELLTVQVSNGKIVRFDYSFVGISVESLENQAREILLPLSIQPIPTPVKWGEFTDPRDRFSFLYPPLLELVQEGSAERWILGDQIRIEVLPFETSWITCFYRSLGDCPAVQKDELVQVNGFEARKIFGYFGSVGGNIPQEFVTYIYTLGDQALVMTLYALPFDSESVDIDQIWPVEGMQLELFQSTVDTVQIHQ